MQVRRRARVLALQTLYEADLANHSPDQVLQRHFQDSELPSNGQHFASQLVSGVIENEAQLDELIGRWANERNTGECFGDFAIRAGIVPEVIIASKDFHD